MEPLSKWTDFQLQKVVHLCPAYTMDSCHFLNDIKHLKNLPNCKLVTINAVRMYANINSNSTLDSIEKWFALHQMDIPSDFPINLVLESIKQPMKFNVFTFGSRFFLQLNGTAMGTNIGYMYATIYYSYHKETRLLQLSYI